MALLEGKTPSERNKTIAAISLGGIAVIAMGYLFFGGESTPQRPRNANTTAAQNRNAGPTTTNQAPASTNESTDVMLAPVSANFPVPASADAGRNIFSFYEAPPLAVSNANLAASPSPTPPPPLLLASVTPQHVYARTGDFTLEVSGNKFVAGSQIFVNEAQLPTRFINAQQLSAKVPAQMIAGEGARQIVVRTTDGKLYSNSATFEVLAPPIPNFSYIGLLRTKTYLDTAILEDKGTKTQVTVQRGDIVGGRFRATSISEREIVLTDSTLQIKHSIPLTGSTATRTSPFVNQPREQKPDEEEDEGEP
jgi:hypothetical protein